MSRSFQIVMALLIIHSGAAFVGATGIGADWGIDPAPGAEQKIDQINEDARSISASNGIGGTLFGLIVTSVSIFDAILTLIPAGPSMFTNLGVPVPIVALVFGPMYVVMGAELAEALSGRSFT